MFSLFLTYFNVSYPSRLELRGSCEELLIFFLVYYVYYIMQSFIPFCLSLYYMLHNKNTSAILRGTDQLSFYHSAIILKYRAYPTCSGISPLCYQNLVILTFFSKVSIFLEMNISKRLRKQLIRFLISNPRIRITRI